MITTYCDKSYVNVVSLSKYLIATVLAFSLKGSTLQLLFGVSKLLASLLLRCGAMTK